MGGVSYSWAPSINVLAGVQGQEPAEGCVERALQPALWIGPEQESGQPSQAPAVAHVSCNGHLAPVLRIMGGLSTKGSVSLETPS